MSEKGHATIGDALIFMTKAAIALGLIAALVGGGLFIWHDAQAQQIKLQGRHINALRVQLTALEQALDLERARVEDQRAKIEKIGAELDVCLADGR